MTVDKEWKRGYYVLYDTPSPSLGQFRQTLYALKSENEPYYMADENGAYIRIVRKGLAHLDMLRSQTRLQTSLLWQA